jgi:L-alanine-DL-glutamate epimerase-like enolase superfamily enzyme
MKITRVHTQPYTFELTRPIGDANLPEGGAVSRSLAVFIETDEGVTGISPSGLSAQPHIHDLVNSLLVGEDPRGVRGLWQKMVDAVFKANNRGLINDAIGAIDVALWDLKAKANGEPLWKTLGASTNKVRAYASGIDLNLSDDELRQFYAGLAKQGVYAGKLKVGLEIESDLRRLGIVREALATSGKPPMLMIDSNEYWSPKQAIRHIKEFERSFELVWAEEPARRWDFRGLRKVSQSVNAAVATGENLDDISEFMPLIANEAVDIVQFNHGCSGITGALIVADMAYGFDLPVAMMNCAAHFMAHVAAALPNHMMMEVVEAGQDAAMIHSHHIEDGWIVLSHDLPGLGIEFDEAKLEELSRYSPAPSARPLGWGRREGAGLVEVGPSVRG